MASHKPNNIKDDLQEVLRSARELSEEIARLLGTTSNYDLMRQLKKVDAEMLDVQHNLMLAIEMQEDTDDAAE
ncbi:MAG: hypothetical protein IT585_11015 [candidate division Zixibacteria bacterium]|nr:hypothetical protein [candidate division Zixibacteria bacterium]